MSDKSLEPRGVRMSDVTYSTKRYIFVCAGCNRLSDTGRRDTMTCDVACRVRAHRSGKLRDIRATAKALKIRPAMIAQAAAVARLRPDLHQRILAGVVEPEDVRVEVCNAFDEVLRRAVELCS